MKDLELIILENFSGLNKKQLKDLKEEDQEKYGVDILLILALTSFLIQVIPIIVKWWRNRKLIDRIRLRLIISKELRKRGINNISSKHLTDVVYKSIMENTRLLGDYSD